MLCGLIPGILDWREVPRLGGRGHVPLKRFLEGIVGHKAYLGASSQPVE